MSCRQTIEHSWHVGDQAIIHPFPRHAGITVVWGKKIWRWLLHRTNVASVMCSCTQPTSSINTIYALFDSPLGRCLHGSAARNVLPAGRRWAQCNHQSIVAPLSQPKARTTTTTWARGRAPPSMQPISAAAWIGELEPRARTWHILPPYVLASANSPTVARARTCKRKHAVLC
jgi:hypothetical protein